MGRSGLVSARASPTKTPLHFLYTKYLLPNQSQYLFMQRHNNFSQSRYFIGRVVGFLGLLYLLLGSNYFTTQQSLNTRPQMLLNLIYLEHYDLEVMSVFRLLYHKAIERCLATSSDCHNTPQYKFVIREPREDSKIMTALVLLDMDKHNDILVVSNKSDIVIESLQVATQSQTVDFIYISDATSWIHFYNMIKFLASLPSNKSTCFGCFLGSGEMDFDFYKNPGMHLILHVPVAHHLTLLGVLVSTDLAVQFVKTTQKYLFASKPGPDLSYYASIRRFSSFLATDEWAKANCHYFEHLRVYSDPFMDHPTSHPYISDSLVVGGIENKLGYLVKAAVSHDHSMTGVKNPSASRKNVEKLFRKQRWSIDDKAGAYLSF